MIKKIVAISTFLTFSLSASGMEIKKIVDSSGHITYTNLGGGIKGKIIKRFDSDGIIYFKNARSSLSNHIIKTGKNQYTYRPGYEYPSIFYRFSDSFRSPYGNDSVNKSRYTNLIADAASRNQVDEKLVHAVIQAESAYNPSAVSRAGAVGLMQLMPDTARRFGVYNRNDPAQNVNGGTRYLRELLDMFNDVRLAVAAYNAGEGAVMKYNYSIPPYPETQNYVRQVLALYRRSL